jgi:hypothetical protein
MKLITKALIFVSSIYLASPALAGETVSPADARVYFVNLMNGAQVTAPFSVVFSLSGMGVAPAGTENANTGHHHLLIDSPPLGQSEDGADELEYGLPSDAQHIHFGGGQTEVTIDLPSGQHSLQLVLGDYAHTPHNQHVVSEVIHINVD